MAERKHEATVPQRLGLHELRGDLAGFLRQAKDGASFLITSQDEVLAELRPPSMPVHADRRPGALRGRIHMSSDFDALPPDVLAAMEGETG